MIEISDILLELAKSKEEDLDLNEVLNLFREYYKNGKRHEYSEVTGIIIEINNEIPDSIEVIQENLKNVIELLTTQSECPKKENTTECHQLDLPHTICDGFRNESCRFDNKALLKSLNKLYDHIGLEAIRLATLGNMSGIIDALEKSVLDSESKVLDTEKRLKKAEKGLNKANRDVKQQQTQYVTILSIFATIVVTFTGGIAFSGSVLEGIDAISPYRLAAVIIGLGFILFNVIYLLTWLILKINDKEKESINKAILYMVNGILIIAICITYGLYKDSALDKKQVNDNANLHIEYNLNNNLNGSN